MTKPEQVYSPHEAAQLAKEQITDFQANPNKSLVTGIADFDKHLYPLRSNICIIHGITDHGKSTLADIITENNLPQLGDGEIVVKVLLEDTIEEQAIREASIDTDPFLSVQDITSGKMSDEQIKTFDKALTHLQGKPVWRVGNSMADHRSQKLTTAPMLLEALNWITDTQQKRIRLVVVDYFQSIAAHARSKNMREIYIEQVDMLDSMAQGFGCPLLLLSQSNRTPDEQKRIPMKSDLQETSRLEQRARTVICVYRPHMHHPIGTYWKFGGAEHFIKDDKLVLLGIQKQKHMPAPVYKLFRTNEQRKMVPQDSRPGIEERFHD